MSELVSPYRRRVAWLAVLWLAALSPAARAQPVIEPGQPVVDVVAGIRELGVTIVYSDDVLTRDMRVGAAPPRPTDPVDALRAILRQHGLALERGPRDTWLVVRSDTAQAPAREPAGRIRVEPPALESVVVTASHYSFVRPTAASSRTIDRDTLESSPALGQDVLRVAHGLPGISSSGLTARSHIRGGELDEVLLRLDGVRLFDPFHLKDFQGLFSSIPPRVLGSMDVLTGGYPARFGHRMSGVLDMHSLSPSEPRRYEVGVSTLTTSVLSTGIFARGRGEWVTSLRRGNLDLVVDAVESDLGDPQYLDFFNKLGYELTPRWHASVGTLLLDDKISLVDEGVARAGAGYDDSYLWLRLEQDSGRGLEGTYVLSRARLSRRRDGVIDDDGRVSGRLAEQRHYDHDALTAEWSWQRSRRGRLVWGVELARERARHAFESSREVTLGIVAPALDGAAAPSAAATAALDGQQYAAHATYRFRPVGPVTVELGLRWEDASDGRGGSVDPRLGLRYDAGDRTRLRVSWGRFVQPPRLDEIDFADGVTTLPRTQEAEHYVASVERLIGSTVTLTLEAYRKEFERINPRFENLFERVSLIPELLADRFRIAPLRAETTGVELSIEGGADRWTWWANLSRADTEDTLADASVQRSWDEPWSVKGGFDWRGARWNVAASTTLRSGWPFSTVALDDGTLVADPYNAERFGRYRSVDIRAERRIELERGELRWFVELGNALDSANLCCLDARIETDGGAERLALEQDHWFGRVPTVGILWSL